MNRLFLWSLLIPLFLSACKDDDAATPDCPLEIPAEDRLFEFRHAASENTFLAWTSQEDVIQQVESQLALPEAQRGFHINGVIKRLPEACDLNQKWSWYFSPTEWVLAEVSIELCDGNPQYVEENLDEYVNNVGAYCPWGSVVLREITDR